MSAPSFPRIGGESTVFDAVTVSYRNGAYAATARRDGIRASVRMSGGYGPATASNEATAAAWLARVKMSERWRDEGISRGEHLRELSEATHAEWTDPERYAAVVSVEVPGHAYIVTFIPRDILARGAELATRDGRRA